MKDTFSIIMIRSFFIAIALFIAFSGHAQTGNPFTSEDKTQSILNDPSNFMKEVSLFDANGDAVAYIDGKDQYTIFLFDGTPAAYLYLSNNVYHIYSFGGQHLGWFVNGLIIDHNGSMVGTSKNTLPVFYHNEGIKEMKQMKPIKKLKAPEPFIPMFTGIWTEMNLDFFFRSSVDTKN